MNGHEGTGGGAGVGVDVPQVPLSADAWGTGSKAALDLPDVPAEPAVGEGELLHESGAWKAQGASDLRAGDSVPLGQGGTGGTSGKVGTGGKAWEAEPGDKDPVPVPELADRKTQPSGVDRRATNSRTAQRRSGVDPVKVLMHRHRDLCERAVDPLEIAAELEAHGVTDRTAARFRHKDVFSLAEEMYARVPRDGDQDELTVPVSTPSTHARGAWAGLALLPGAVCALVLFALTATAGTARVAVGVGGGLAVAAALRSTLRHGPLRAGAVPAVPATRLWTGWLLAYAVLGDGLLNAALAGGPDAAWAPATAPLLALVVAVAPASWCAGLFVAGARRRLATSRGLAEFASSVRPLLLASVVLYVLALAALLGLSGALLDQEVDYAGAGALGVLLLLARLLTAHGRTHAPSVVLGAAAAVEALAVGLVFAARLPGCGVLGAPVEAAVDAAGAGVVPATACAVAAVALLIHATRTLTRASAHAYTEVQRGGTR